MTSWTINAAAHSVLESCALARLVSIGYCCFPFRYGVLHCHCDRPQSLQCMSRGVFVLQMLKSRNISIITNSKLNARIIDNHAYIDVKRGYINHLIRLLYQLDIEATIFKAGSKIIVFSSSTAIQRVLDVSMIFENDQITTQDMIRKETLLLMNKLNSQVFVVKTRNAMPRPERGAGKSWLCWWLVSLCTCIGRCNCRVTYENSMVQESTIRLMLEGKVDRPTALVRYVRHWFKVTRSGVDLMS